MSFAEFFSLFFLMILVGSLSVTGWYFITRGNEIIREDGSKVRRGKIFMNWYFYWTKTNPVKKKVYFDEAHLYKFYLDIRHHFILPGTRDMYEVEHRGLELVFTSPKIQDQLKFIENGLDVKFLDKGSNHYAVYKEYDDYVFPSWVRDPLAVCATCFSSIYGALFYWPLIAMIKEPVFAWSGAPAFSAFFFWVAFSFSLSVVNTALAKKFN